LQFDTKLNITKASSLNIEKNAEINESKNELSKSLKAKSPAVKLSTEEVLKSDILKRKIGLNFNFF
jgi:hypothetical protein